MENTIITTEIVEEIIRKHNNIRHTGKCLNCGKELTDANVAQFNEFCTEKCLYEHVKQVSYAGQFMNTPYWQQNAKYLEWFSLIRDIQQIETNIRALDKAVFDKTVPQDNAEAIRVIEEGRRFIPYTIGNSKIRTAPSKFIGYVANTPELHRHEKELTTDEIKLAKEVRDKETEIINNSHLPPNQRNTWLNNHKKTWRRIENRGWVLKTLDWRDGRVTNPKIDTILVNEGILSHELYNVIKSPTNNKRWKEYLNDNEEYKQKHEEFIKAHKDYCDLLGTYPRPTSGNIDNLGDVKFWPLIHLPE